MNAPRISAPDLDLADMIGWLAERREAFDELLVEDGALFVSGLPIGTPADVAMAGDVLLGPRMRPLEQDTVHTDRADRVYAVADGPASDPACLHQRYSYALHFPSRVLSACLTAPARGGAVLLGDTRKIVKNVPQALVERLRSVGWLLRRTYLDDVGVGWPDALGTADRTHAVDVLRRNEILGTWHPDGCLTTQQRRPALATLPGGEECWFNDILYYSSWSNEPEIRALLIETYGPDRLPFDTRFGDGTELSEEDSKALRAAYDSAEVSEPWSAGDLLLVDNLRMAHGRAPYQGTRDVVVTFGS